MNKSYVITFSISVIVIFSIAIILLMIMLPQAVNIVDADANKYEQVSKSDYTFQKTKDVSEESLQRQYNITPDEISTFIQKQQYKPGNSDPFTPAGTDTNPGNNNGNGGTDNNGNDQDDADEDTTNSNGGVPNPPSANK